MPTATSSPALNLAGAQPAQHPLHPHLGDVFCSLVLAVRKVRAKLGQVFINVIAKLGTTHSLRARFWILVLLLCPFSHLILWDKGGDT